MQRRSYYPSNPQLASTVTATSSTGVDPSRPVTPMTIPNDIAPNDSLNGNGYSQKISPSSEGAVYEADHHQAVQMHDIHNEKAY